MATVRRALLVGVQISGVSDEEHASSLDELARLATTLGLEVVARISQRRAGLAKAAVIGRGKLEALARYTGGPGKIPSPAVRKEQKQRYVHGKEDLEEEDDDEEEAPGEPVAEADRAQVVLVDHEITPSQVRNLGLASGVEVLDRNSVILAIFERHARSREAKIEVEIARLAYAAPRTREVGRDRQRGGIGGRGAGESSLELDRRKVRDRLAELHRELEAIERTAEVRRTRRAEEQMVALVGYTNAGKSSLMRALTESEVYVADKLFATLDTTVRALVPATRPRILVSDTVGFIKKLPHGLVASFRATLEAANEAQLILHVVDASDPAHPSHMEVTEAQLREIGARETPTLLVLNKIDRVDELGRARLAARHPEALTMCAHDPHEVARLHAAIVHHFERGMIDGRIMVPYTRHGVVSEIHARCRVLEEKHGEEGTTLEVRAPSATIRHFEDLLAVR